MEFPIAQAAVTALPMAATPTAASPAGKPKLRSDTTHPLTTAPTQRQSRELRRETFDRSTLFSLG